MASFWGEHPVKALFEVILLIISESSEINACRRGYCSLLYNNAVLSLDVFENRVCLSNQES